MGGFQPWHWVVLAIVVVALFGYNKLPDVTRSVGRSLRIFKTEMKGLSADDQVREHAAQVEAATGQGVATSPPGGPVGSTAPAESGSSTAPSAEDIARARAVLAAAAAHGDQPSAAGIRDRAHSDNAVPDPDAVDNNLTGVDRPISGTEVSTR